MGYRFSLVLNREITEEESAVLRTTGCNCAVFATDIHPTRPDVTVTKMDFDDTTSGTLAEAIESALETVKKVDVPDLSVPGLTVPAQPAGPVGVVAGEVIEASSLVEADSTAPVAAAGTSAAKKAPAKKTAAKVKAASGSPAAV